MDSKKYELTKRFVDLLDYQSTVLTPEEMEINYNQFSINTVNSVLERKLLHETYRTNFDDDDRNSVINGPATRVTRNLIPSKRHFREDVHNVEDTDYGDSDRNSVYSMQSTKYKYVVATNDHAGVMKKNRNAHVRMNDANSTAGTTVNSRIKNVATSSSTTAFRNKRNNDKPREHSHMDESVTFQTRNAKRTQEKMEEIINIKNRGKREVQKTKRVVAQKKTRNNKNEVPVTPCSNTGVSFVGSTPLVVPRLLRRKVVGKPFKGFSTKQKKEPLLDTDSDDDDINNLRIF